MDTPFSPVATATLAADVTSSRVALPGSLRGLQKRTLRVAPLGPDVAFIAFGNSTVTATAAGSMPVVSGMVEFFNLQPGHTHLAAITASGTALLRLTVGEGE